MCCCMMFADSTASSSAAVNAMSGLVDSSTLRSVRIKELCSVLPAFESAILNDLLIMNSPTDGSTDFQDALSLQTFSRRLDDGVWGWERYALGVARLVSERLVTKMNVMYESIFSDLSTERSKTIAKECVKEMNLSETDSSLVYGEIDFFSFAAILERLRPVEGQTFVDLGHGTGKALVATALLHGSKFKKVHGIEILTNLYSESLGTVEKYRQIISKSHRHLFQDTHDGCTVSVSRGSITSVEAEEGEFFDWTQADVVFANSTCFDESLIVEISRMAENMHAGAVVVTLTRPLLSAVFTVVDRRQLPMSWGTATAFTHVRS